mgnify:CR=1 FL=1
MATLCTESVHQQLSIVYDSKGSSKLLARFVMPNHKWRQIFFSISVAYPYAEVRAKQTDYQLRSFVTSTFYASRANRLLSRSFTILMVDSDCARINYTSRINTLHTNTTRNV